MKIVIGNDHTALDMKREIMRHLEDYGSITSLEAVNEYGIMSVDLSFNKFILFRIHMNIKYRFNKLLNCYDLTGYFIVIEKIVIIIRRICIL